MRGVLCICHMFSSLNSIIPVRSCYVFQVITACSLEYITSWLKTEFQNDKYLNKEVQFP